MTRSDEIPNFVPEFESLFMKTIFVGLFSLLILGVQAREPAAEPSVAELSAEVEALKAKTSTWDRILARLPEISGYVQAGCEWSETSSSFFIKRVRLNLAGAIAPETRLPRAGRVRGRRRSSTPISVTGLSMG